MNQREASGSFTLDQNYLPRRAVQPCGTSSCRYVFVYQQEVILEVFVNFRGDRRFNFHTTAKVSEGFKQTEANASNVVWPPDLLDASSPLYILK